MVRVTRKLDLIVGVLFQQLRQAQQAGIAVGQDRAVEGEFDLLPVALLLGRVESLTEQHRCRKQSYATRQQQPLTQYCCLGANYPDQRRLHKKGSRAAFTLDWLVVSASPSQELQRNHTGREHASLSHALRPSRSY